MSYIFGIRYVRQRKLLTQVICFTFSYISLVLKCLDNDGDELQNTKHCEPKDKYCYFKIENNRTSSIERGCSTKDKFGKLHELFYNHSAYNPEAGCFICRKSGGCNDKGNNLHEDMDENESKCYCNTENCNERPDLLSWRASILRNETEIQYWTHRHLSDDKQTSGLGRETSESNTGTTKSATSTAVNVTTKNFSSSNRFLSMLLMIIFIFKMF